MSLDLVRGKRVDRAEVVRTANEKLQRAADAAEKAKAGQVLLFPFPKCIFIVKTSFCTIKEKRMFFDREHVTTKMNF